jgi:hypothetical protein
MAVRISELNELSTGISQSDSLPIVDVSAGETKQATVGSIITVGISGAPSSFIDLAKLNQNSTTKLSYLALANTGVASGIYGSASTVPRFTVNRQGLITQASGIAIVIPAGNVTGLAPVATSGTYQSLSGRPTLGTISSQDANSVGITGGSISGVTFISNNATIRGGSISGITDLAVADGGTGASTASGARTNLGLAIGSNVQAYSSVLDQTVTSFNSANVFIYSSASGVLATGAVGATGRAVLSGSTASGIRSTIGLGTIAVQNANSVEITGGSISGITLQATSAVINGGTISGITDLAIADGGTGASTASDARTNLGLAIGSNVQAYSSALDGISATASGSDLFFYTTASGAVGASSFSSISRNLVAETTYSGFRNTLGLGSVAVLNEIVISSGNISSQAVVTDAIQDSAVTTVKIANGAVTLSKLSSTTTSDVLLGRASASGGTVEEVPCTEAARSILDDASVADIRTTLGLGTLATQDGTFSGTSTGTNTGDQTITLTGDVTGTGTDTFATTISDNSIAEEKIASNAVTAAKINARAVTAAKLDDNSSVVVAADVPTGNGAFIGQQWINSNTGFEYTWDGSVWERVSAISTITFSGSTPIDYVVTYADRFSAQIATSFSTQAANAVLIGPTSGSNAEPSFRLLEASDLPDATSVSKGAIQPGTGLSVSSSVLNHTNTISGATINGFTFDNEGHISGAVALAAEDIPALDATKITTGTFSTAFIENDAVDGNKLADYATAKIGEALPTADYIGQIFFNPLDKAFFLWDGNVWQPIGISAGAIVFAGTYDANLNQVASTTTEGAAIGLSVGSALPAASNTNANYYVVVSEGGTGTSPAPTVTLAPPDLLLSNGASWLEIDVSSTYVAQSAINVAFTPAGEVGATTVQAAIEEVSSECRNASNLTSGTLAVARGGTGQSSYTKGDLLVASGATALAKLATGTNNQVLRVNSSTATGLEWATIPSGTVTSITSNTTALTVSGGTSAAVLTLRSATTALDGIVQLSDSTSSTSSSLAATATAVKSAYDLANAALPKAGGIITGAVVIGDAGSLSFEGSVDDGFETALTVANPTADQTITLPNLTGTVALTSQLDDGTY